MSSLTAVMVVVLVIWVGLFLYLWRLDARIRELAERAPRAPGEEAHEAPAAVIEPRPAAPER
ncbi:MAG: CcmD family protein [Armatimonadetes bacterium]|jgi:CcmD family protein|nr:CcmD family protein [Armatimonadota bacterium]